MQATLEDLRRKRREKLTRRRAAQAANVPTRRWRLPNVIRDTVLAHTKSEARAVFKRLLGRPLPVGVVVLEVL